MAFNMPNPYFTDYVPGQYPTSDHSEDSFDQGWNQENEVYTATPVVPQSSQSNKRKKPASNNDETTGSKKKQNKKAATNNTTINTTSATTTSTESKAPPQQHETKKKQATKESHMIQMEENKTTYNELSIKLTDLTLMQQQMSVLAEKYNEDINIKSELGTSLESWQAAVSNVKNRLDQIPQCRMCFSSPLTKPPKVVGACGHKFCCIDCFGNYYNKMLQENAGQRLCLQCNIDTDITIFK